MDYLKDNFLEDEKIQYKAKYHIILFLWFAFFIVLSLWHLLYRHDDFFTSFYFLSLSSLYGIRCLLVYKYSVFVITNKRLIMKSGLIYKKSIDILLNEVGFYRVKQGLIGELLGYGRFTITLPGGKIVTFKKICDPYIFKERLDKELYYRDIP